MSDENLVFTETIVDRHNESIKIEAVIIGENDYNLVINLSSGHEHSTSICLYNVRVSDLIQSLNKLRDRLLLNHSAGS